MDIYQEFSARNMMACLDSEAFLDYLLRQWTLRGRHLDVCQVIDHPKFEEIIENCKDEDRFSVFVELSQLYQGEIALANTYNDTLLAIVYGEDFDPLDMESTIDVKGDWKYHLWFYYLNNEGYIHEAWELFDTEIYPLCTSLSNTRTEHVQAVSRYFDEICILMQKTKNPDVLYGVDDKTVRNLNELFLLIIRNNILIETSSKQSFCESLVHFMLNKNMHHLGVEFYITFKEFFNLNDALTIINLLGLSEYANDYHAVNVIYGDIQTVKNRIEKYRSDIDGHLEEISEYILRVKQLIEENHSEMLQGDSFIKESFDFFFDECAIYESASSDFSMLSFIEKDYLLRKLLDAVICFFKEQKQLTSKAGNKLEPALSMLIDYELGIEGMRLRNRIISLSPSQGIDYKETVIQDALSQLHDFLTEFYLIELSEDAKVVLQKFDMKVIESYDETKALELLKTTYADLRPSDYSVNHKTSYGFTQEEQQRFAEEDNRVDKLLVCDEVKKLLLTAEWQWQNHVQFLDTSRSEGEDHTGQEYTYIVANYLKAVEVFLCDKLADIQVEKQNLPRIGIYKFGKPKDVVIGEEDYRNDVTMGNLYHYILDYGTTILKPSADKMKVKEYLTHWAANVRNSHFHKDTILSIDETKSIRKDTLVILKRLLSDFEG
ncbi:hypothetical protein ORD22_07850 [Sporosarcina sp. GW1-11]|uniref:hypothetical protein n=1 Tax=Sporosarcina sp. GW1-11 TaxID=2899126 RepID=UPI00294F9B1D|nr:hypothetical protein [Sporosarcina sp. GW1-11]MDV6378161.1 hypothetical protein [Sporosarcina sp. GW1-11]